MGKSRLLSAALALCLLLAGCAGGRSDTVPSQGASVESAQSQAPEAAPGAGKAAIYIYMCGSTLETKHGAASKNIEELLRAEIPAGASVVIETGGAKKWRGAGVSADALTRYEVQDGALRETQRLENASMGAAETLADFLDYCASEYPAEKTALILWDHGGGALGEVCYDENFRMDCLTAQELDEALAGTHFDLIGLDACLMATGETAAHLQSHADYLLASEEIEPTGGWAYAALAESFSPGVDMEAVGRAVCDAYIEKCEGSVGGDVAALSLMDLRAYGDFSAAFDAFAESLSAAADEAYGNFAVVRAARQAARFGAVSPDEGYSNLIDLYGFADALGETRPEAKALTDAIETLVVYQVSGAGRSGLGGVSLFFPQGYTPAELEDYLAYCSSVPYQAYLSAIYGHAVSNSVTFEDMGSVDESGNFHTKLTEESRRYLRSVGFSLLRLTYNENAEEHMEWVCLGEGDDIETNWDSLSFTSDFRGTWLALNGAYLNCSVVERGDGYTIFSAPVQVNGERTNLRFMFVEEAGRPDGGYYKLIGLWGGLDENDLADKQIVPLKPGDTVTVLQKKIDPMADVTVAAAPLSEGETVTIGEDGGEISALPLEDSSQYRYIFIADDIFGNRFYSDTASFQLRYTYEELLNDPLPEGVCAGEIVDIQWDSFWGSVG